MSEAVVVAIVTAASAVLVTIVASVVAPLVLSRLRAIEAQVANDHKHPDGTPINLRDDLDDKHDQNHRILSKLQSDMTWVVRQIAELRRDHDDLEDTVTKGQPHE